MLFFLFFVLLLQLHNCRKFMQLRSRRCMRARPSVCLPLFLSLCPSVRPSVFALAFRAADYQQTPPQFARHEANASSSGAANGDGDSDSDCDVCCTCCLTEIRRVLAQVPSCGSRVADCQFHLHKSLQQM